VAYHRIGDLLVSIGAISEAQLEEALAENRRTKKRIGSILIDNHYISEHQLIDALRQQLGVDFIDLTTARIPQTLAQLVPKATAEKHGIVPVKLLGDDLYIAMNDPLNFNAIEEVKSTTRKHIIPMIAASASLERAISTLYGNERVSRAIDELQKTVGDEVAIAPDSSNLSEDDALAAPSIRLVNSIIERAITENASDIHMEPRDDGMVVRMRIDGVMLNILTVPKNLQNSIIARIKVMSAMDIAERRIPQDGRTNVTVRDMDVDLRVSTLPTIYGEKLVIRLLMKSAALLSSKGIGLVGGNLAKYTSLIQNANGVILIAGPTGSGKSSTKYTMISDLNRETVNLVTLEDPVEYNLAGVNQVQINEKIGMTFANGLRSILRQDPDIIAVGEIRDGETAEIAVRAAITGHLVLSTIHTSDAVSTIDRLLDVGVEPYMIASALKGVVSQRLLRRICPRCRREREPTDDDYAALGLDKSTAPHIHLYEGAGCPDCHRTGYRGRTAVFEVLVMTGEVKNKVRERATRAQLVEAVSRSGFEPILADCRRLALEGATTIEEINRILHSTE
jgi:type IV pilus assembly protein PilB